MKSYKVSFFKDLLSDDGHRFKCLQRAIEIHRARSLDRAVQAAECRYARWHRVGDWHVHADSLEVEVDGKKVLYRPSRAEVLDLTHGKH